MQSNYLMHHGVKGQRHGHRRYQNEDGSYTQEGREHYGIGDGSRQSSKFVSEKSFTSNPSERRREELSRIVKTKDKSSKPEENSKGKGTGKKALKIAAGVAAAAAATAAGVIAYKKATLLRDAMRSQASLKAKEWMDVYTKNNNERLKTIKDVKWRRSIANDTRWNNYEREYANHWMHKGMKKAHELTKATNEAQSNYYKYSRVAAVGTRRDAVIDYAKKAYDQRKNRNRR